MSYHIRVQSIPLTRPTYKMFCLKKISLSDHYYNWCITKTALWAGCIRAKDDEIWIKYIICLPEQQIPMQTESSATNSFPAGLWQSIDLADIFIDFGLLINNSAQISRQLTAQHCIRNSPSHSSWSLPKHPQESSSSGRQKGKAWPEFLGDSQSFRTFFA